ncbi:MAG TPA: hypothetical protein VMW38_03935, partial [Terriglobia bacterium]|nr:hypothetical protein [Terriglobia bacterium]
MTKQLITYCLLLMTAGYLGAEPRAAYQYYFTEPQSQSPFSLTNWWINGSVSTGPTGFSAASANGGSLISKLANGGTTQYEVKTILTLTVSGGTYIHYLRASQDAMSGPAATGTFYSIELKNVTINGSSGSGTLEMRKRENGVFTVLTSTTVPCHNNMTMRSVIRPGQIGVYVDDLFYLWSAITDSFLGQPGVGALATPTGNLVAAVGLGPADTTCPPIGVDPSSVATSVFPTSANFQWQPVMDGNNSWDTGVAFYQVYRNGVWIQQIIQPEFTDATVSPSTTYQYAIYALDYHLNGSQPAVLSVTTPPAGSVDPRRVGVRPNGTYWGAGGEQIDTRSGNLNFTLPLVHPQGRGGRKVPISLNYNSQLWRNDNGVVWKLGRDVGYGFGWKLLAGSITPYWYGYWSLHHFIFTD